MVEELKTAYQQRIERQNNNNINMSEVAPWRSSTSVGGSSVSLGGGGGGGSVFKRRDLPLPTEPIQKLILRMIIARRTLRLDLSCRSIWEEEKANQDDTNNNNTSSSPSPSSSSYPATLPSTLPVIDSDIKTGDETDSQRMDSSSLATGEEGGGGGGSGGGGGGGGQLSHSDSHTMSMTTINTALDKHLCASFRLVQSNQSSSSSVAGDDSMSHVSKMSEEEEKEEVEEVLKLHHLPVERAFVDFRLSSLPSDIWKLTGKVTLPNNCNTT
eukprot:scaffold4349_cov178-Ochromonas_danica.AAC.1